MSEYPEVRAFANALRRLHRDAHAPSRTQVEQHAKIPRATLNSWLDGVSVPSDRKVFEYLVAYLQRLAGIPVRPDALEALRGEAERVRNQNRGGRPRRTQGPAELPAAGQLIDEIPGPLALDVHECIDAGAEAAGLPPWTAYVRRPHDAGLTDAVLRAAGGSSQVAVVVGEPATGKTRACWEAIQVLPAGWRLVSVLAPDLPTALLDVLPAIGPRTVIWLDDAWRYLRPNDERFGEHVAAGLLRLLRDPARAPLLILVTIWSKEYGPLSEAGTGRDRTQVSKLLAAPTFFVPDRFHEAEIQDALRTSDPRLAEAAARAESGRITQYVAGVPELLRRYAGVTAPTRALIHIAIDARRIGYTPPLAAVMFIEAISGYLSGYYLDRLGPDWFETAVAAVREPSRGTPGPLTELTGPDGVRSYRLAPYLETVGTDRASPSIRLELWEALLRHAPAGSLLGLGNEARRRSLHRIAAEAFQAAAAASQPGAWTHIARLLSWTRRDDQALAAWRLAAQHGDASAYLHGAHLLERMNRVDESLAWYAEAARAGVDEVPDRKAQVLAGAGRHDEAFEVLAEMSEHDSRTTRQAADSLWRAGRYNEAVEWYDRAAAAGDMAACRRVPDALAEVGRLDEALVRYKQLTDDGDRDARLRAAIAIRRLKGTRTAVAWLDEQTDDVATCLHQAGLFLQADGHDDEAAVYLRRAALATDARSPYLAGRYLERAGFLPEAIEAYREAASAGGPTTMIRRAVELMIKTGRTEEALAWLRSLVESGHRRARHQLRTTLARLGLIDDLVTDFEVAASTGDMSALEEAAAVLTKANRVDEAVALYVRLAKEGRHGAALAAATLLADAGRVADALPLFDSIAHDALDDRVTLLLHLNRRDDAVSWLTRLGETGNADAWLALGRLLNAELDVDGARDAFRHATELGCVSAYLDLFHVLADAGRTNEAIDAALSRAEAGDVEAPFLATTLMGQDDPRSQALIHYGIEPGGRVASEWHIKMPPASPSDFLDQPRDATWHVPAE